MLKGTLEEKRISYIRNRDSSKGNNKEHNIFGTRISLV